MFTRPIRIPSAHQHHAHQHHVHHVHVCAASASPSIEIHGSNSSSDKSKSKVKYFEKCPIERLRTIYTNAKVNTQHTDTVIAEPHVKIIGFQEINIGK